MSSGYHPQSDGQIEVLNRCLETYLRCFVGGQPRNWVKWLAWAEWCLNTSYHTASKIAPFELVYGYHPPHLATYEMGSTRVDSVEQSLIERDKMISVLRANLELAQNRMNVQADKKRSERQFEVGDLVYLKLVPYQLQSLALHSYHKLQPRYYGPYEVMDQIGAVAYKLNLPEGSKIHPVFHVSCLKKQLDPDVVVQSKLPHTLEDDLAQHVPEGILARMIYKKGNSAGVQVLVQWLDKETTEATWEDFYDFQYRFPNFKPCGQGS